MKQAFKLLLVLLVLTLGSTRASADAVRYLTYDGSTITEPYYQADATKITSSSIELSGWYYVEGNVEINSKVTLSGDTHLILCDGAKLTINSGNDLGIDNNTITNKNLTIYAQSSGSHAGKLIIKSSSGAGGSINVRGNLTINGGTIKITNQSTTGAGIYCTGSGLFTMNGGNLTADAFDGMVVNECVINGGIVTLSGDHYGIYTLYDNFTINGGQVTAHGGFYANYDYKINIGWKNASDFIKSNSYNKLPTPIGTKKFNIEGGGTFESGIVIDKESLAGKKLTPNTTTPSHTITLATGITGGSIAIDKTKAFEYERVAITATPETGKMLTSLSYTYGSTTVNIFTSKEANDYVFTMPDADVTSINATFETVVAKIGTTEYASLDDAFSYVGDAETIDIFTDTDESATNHTPAYWNLDFVIDLHGHDVKFGDISKSGGDLTIKSTETDGKFLCSSLYDNNGNITIDNVTMTCTGSISSISNVTIKNSTVTLDEVNNPNVNLNETFLVDGSTVVCKDFSWMAKHVELKNGANVEITNSFQLGSGDDGITFTIDKLEDPGSSVFTLTNCTVRNGYGQETLVKSQMEQYTAPGQSITVDGSKKHSLSLRKTWGVILQNGLGEVSPGVDRATVTFFDGGTTFDPAAFDPTDAAYADGNKVSFVNNSDGIDRYIIMHVVPAEYYWTDAQLLAGFEAAASLAPRRDPGIVSGNEVKLLKADTYSNATGTHDRNDGSGWYYYKLPGTHTPTAGYLFSLVKGFVLPKFDLYNYTITQDATTKTVTVDNTSTGWTAEIAFTPESREVPFDATVHTPVISSITVKKDGTEAVALTSGFDKQLTVTGGKKIGNCPMTLKAANDFSWFLTNTQDNTISFTINVPLTVDDPTAAKGTSTNPWRVRNIGDMKLFAQCVNDGGWEFINEHVKLTDNLTYDAISSAAFLPVGYSTGSPSSAFCGTFDGNHMTISNLEYTNGFSGGCCTVGLFGQVGSSTVPALIKDLTLSHCTFNGGAKDGALVGALAGGAVKTTISGVNVINCILKGPEAVTPLPGGNVKIIQIGGLVGGIMDGSQITNCTVKNCTMTNDITSGVTQVTEIRIGGIAGNIHSIEITGCTVDNCIISANYANGNGNCLGGLVGNAYGSTLTNNRVKGSTSISDVTGLDKVCFVSAIYSKSTGDVSTTTISNNTYDYDVTLSRTNSEGTKSAHGYTKRGLWNNTSSAWEDVDGAMMYIKQATLPAETANGSKVEFNEVTKGTDRYDHGDDDFYYAVGAPVTLKVTTGTSTDGDIRTFYDQLSTLTMNGTDIKDALGFTMPEADATIAATFTPSDWFTILPTNTQYLMSLFHEWEPTGAVNYAVSDGTPGIADADKKTIVLSTVTAISDTEAITTDLGGISYAGIPTIISCKDATGAEVVIPQLRFDPKNDAPTAPTPDSRFKGTTTDKVITPNDVCYVLNTQGKFILTYVTDGMPAVDKTLKAHRCYIDMSGSTAAPVLSLVDGSGTTSLENVRWQTDDEVGEWFTLDGRKLSAKPTTKGLYIFNGKKVVVR